MLIVKHRVNSITDLRSTSSEYGVEVDIRSGLDGLYLSHDPFMEGPGFSEWLKSFNHRFLIINVKEDGLEEQILLELRALPSVEYFFLDQAMPTQIRRGMRGFSDGALRLSEYESLDSVLRLSNFADWLWVDFFHQPEISKEKLLRIREAGLQVCLVSPELHDPQRLPEAELLRDRISEYPELIDAVCTKFPHKWTGLCD